MASKIRTRRPLEVRFPAAGVCALESRHARGFAMAWLRHDYLKVLLVVAGAGELQSGAGAMELAPGDVVVVPPECEHRIVDDRPLSLYALCFRAEDYASAWDDVIRESGKPWRETGAAGELWEATRRLLHEQVEGRKAADAMARGLAWQLLALLARAPAGAVRPVAGDPTGSRARVAAAWKDLRDRFYEPLRIDSAAARAGLGRRRFTQLFKAVNGTTWWEALNAARLAHAERLLVETDRSVAAVAFECGYGDLSGFYRAWAGPHATSPTVWRHARGPAGV